MTEICKTRSSINSKDRYETDNSSTDAGAAFRLQRSQASPPLLPQGNMPMTEQEYQESELLLLKKRKLPPEEYQQRRNEILDQNISRDSD